ncbi:MAG: hypothetical protein IJI57_04335 [Flexilinea sp.]|nr:hypothetical protein [Flexilinea sp.]
MTFDEKMKIAKKLMKKIKPYFDEKKNDIQPDAPEDIKSSYERFMVLLDELMDDEELFYDPGYHLKKDK